MREPLFFDQQERKVRWLPLCIVALPEKKIRRPKTDTSGAEYSCVRAYAFTAQPGRESGNPWEFGTRGGVDRSMGVSADRKTSYAMSAFGPRVRSEDTQESLCHRKRAAGRCHG